MPSVEHVEKHFTATAAVRDIVIGMSDGLTVPFALAAGLSGAVTPTNIVVTAGLAEIAAGSIAMGLGGYLAAKTDSEHYASEREREIRETVELPEVNGRGCQSLPRLRTDRDANRAGRRRNHLRPETLGRFHDALRAGARRRRTRRAPAAAPERLPVLISWEGSFRWRLTS